MITTEIRIDVFGKTFLPQERAGGELLVHGDFPAITRSDIDAFKDVVMEKPLPVISGRLAEIHPYRVMYTDMNGFAVPLADIPQKIRGNRHYYPDIYEFVPALVWLPENLDFELFMKESTPEMYIMPGAKLLDKTRFPDWLFLKNKRE